MSEKLVYSGKKGSKSTPGKKPKISRRRPLNRHELEAPEDLNVSTSAKKLKMSEDLYDVEVDEAFGYRLINFIAVFSAISNLVVCKVCKSEVKFSESGKRGLGFKIVVSCKNNCKQETIPSGPFIGNGYEINRRIVLVMRLLGVGLYGITKFCAFMELPRPMFHSFYDKIVQHISTATDAICKRSISNAAKKEKAICTEKGEINGITVSGDGSWRKRGFSSLFGIVTLIGYNTGKVIDYVVKSKYCKACEYWSKKSDTEEYFEWAESHASECTANHEGSAGKMEVDSVIEMFQRSQNLHDIKYAYYVGDGDSKTFKGVVNAKPYENFEVHKKECVDHVQKRMGTRLRNLKKKVKGLGGKGKLTGKLIDSLTIYYGLAIRRNSDSVEKMRNEIWATLYHKLSTDENPQHDKCPAGENSWCSWQKAKATNTLDSYKHKPALSKDVFDAIKPVYEELSSDDLLVRCIGGYTQNSNESLNSTVWTLAPKSVSSGKNVLDIATNISVCVYNDGFSSIMHIFHALDMKIGPNSYNKCLEVDEQRIKHAEQSLSDAAKQARIALKAHRKEELEQDVNLEGQLYGAGISD